MHSSGKVGASEQLCPTPPPHPGKHSVYPLRGAKCPNGPRYFSITKFLSSPHHPSRRFSLFPSSIFSTLNPTCHQVHAQYCPTLCSILDLQPAALFSPWDVPGKNIAVRCHFLLQGIFASQGSNPGLCIVSCIASRFFPC